MAIVSPKGYCIYGERVGLVWIVERRVAMGFESIKLRMLTIHLDYMMEKEHTNPGLLHRAICDIYPIEPKPSPQDIVGITVTKIIKPLHHINITLTIKRGHYTGGLPESISVYDWSNFDEEEETP